MRSVALLVVLALTVGACGAVGTAGPGDGSAPSTRPTALAIPLSDVRTGERFTLGSFPGKVTFFIAMAVW